VTHRFYLFLVALISFGLLDGLWLGVLMGGFYRTQLSLIGRMSGDKLAPLWGPALFVYVLLAFGIVGLVLPRNYADASSTRRRLEGAGFRDVETNIQPSPVAFPDADAFTAFVSTVVLRPVLSQIRDEGSRKSFVDRITDLSSADSPAFELDYQRLNIRARKP